MPAYAPRPAAFGAAAGGPVGQGQVSLEPPEAFAAALQAIAASGGQLTWQSAPNAARFNMVKKSFLTTGGLAVNYAGDLQVQRTGPSQSTVAMSLKINWNNYIPIALTSVIAMVLFLMWNPGFGMLMILLMGASIGYSAWQLSSQVPELFLRTILGHLNVSPIGAPAGAPAAVSPLQGAPPTPVTVLPGAAPAPAPPAPQAPPAPAAAAPPAAPAEAEESATEIMDQIRQLAELRDAGAITAQDFEAKKAELLARI